MSPSDSGAHPSRSAFARAQQLLPKEKKQPARPTDEAHPSEDTLRDFLFGSASDTDGIIIAYLPPTSNQFMLKQNLLVSGHKAYYNGNIQIYVHTLNAYLT